MTTSFTSKINQFIQTSCPVLKNLLSMENTYLVGGVVRDLLFKESGVKDIDIVTGDPIKFIKKNSKLIKTVVLLDEEFEVYRIFLRNEQDFYLDTTRLQGNNIIEDLSRRDFSINAIAVSFCNDIVEIIDPFGGIDDVKNGLIRKLNKANLLADPLRMLRAFRFKAELGFEIEEATLRDIKELFSNINKVAKERIKGEIFKILSSPIATKTFYELYQNNGLKFIFPFISEYEDYFSGKRHKYDLLHHSFKVMETIENFINENSFPISFDNDILVLETENEATLAGLLKLSAIFHDVGKLFTKNEIDGKITYYEHEKVGAEFIKDFLQKEKFASDTINFIAKMIRYHMYPFHILFFGEKEASLSPRSYLKIKGILENKAELLFNFAIADTIATTDGLYTKKMIDLIKKLYNLYLDYEKKDKKTNIMNGIEVMQLLGISQGPIVGKLLRSLKEMFLAGEINTKEEAKEFLKKYYEENVG